jgi:ABC-type branched-subunit amino acid transport system substrate-binding protein
MRKKWSTRTILGAIVFLMAASVILGAANVNAEVPEVVTIKVGGVMTLTGPGAFWHGPGGKAEIAYFKHFNKQGGMAYTEPDGSKHRFVIDLKYEDCAYSGKKAVTSYGRLRDWGAHMITTHGSSPGAALIAACARDRVPVLHMWAVHPDPKYYRENVDEMYLLPASATDVDATHGLLYMFKKYVWDKEHAGQPFKAGVIAFDNPPRRLYKKRFVKDLYAKSNIELVGASIVPISVTDVSIELKRLYDAGAKVVVVDHTVGGLKVVLEDAQRLGIKDKIYWIAWFNLLKQFLAAPDLFDGVYNPWSYPMYYSSARTPMMEKAGQIFLDDDPEYWTYRVDWAIGPYHNLSVGMEAIKRCLEKYGYEKFDRIKLREMLFSPMTIDNGIYPKFTIDPQFPYTAPYGWMYQLDAKNKIYHPVGDKPVAMGPSVYQPRWNPGDDPKAVLTEYYEYP